MSRFIVWPIRCGDLEIQLNRHVSVCFAPKAVFRQIFASVSLPYGAVAGLTHYE